MAKHPLRLGRLGRQGRRWPAVVAVCLLALLTLYCVSYVALRVTGVFVHYDSRWIEAARGFRHAVYSQHRPLNVLFFPALYLETSWLNGRFVRNFG